MSTRRQFLQQAALISLSPLIPAFLSQTAAAAAVQPDERVLVVIQLDGGNDGLNTVVPYADETYGNLRRELRIKTSDVLKLDDAVGLNTTMKPAMELFEKGQLAIVQGVGYPNPNRSHFESMAIWHHARLETRDHDGNGWLGRAAELTPVKHPTAADSYYVGQEAVPVALRGRRANAVSLQSEADLQLVTPLDSPKTDAASGDLAAFVQRTQAQSFEAARQFRESAEAQSATIAEYPGSKIATKLQLVAKLLKLGGGTRIYYVSQPGYDTHAAQLYPHAQLLREFAGGLKAFLTDLTAAGLAERVVVLAFSEFGRRAEENGSAGTDHGAAAPVFLAGAPVRGGLVGAHPSLTDLDQGDLKMAIDFRQIYATLLDGWLGISSRQGLFGDFGALPLLKT
jgi:uncharacterized protein (DUF1501 family)